MNLDIHETGWVPLFCRNWWIPFCWSPFNVTEWKRSLGLHKMSCTPNKSLTFCSSVFHRDATKVCQTTFNLPSAELLCYWWINTAQVNIKQTVIDRVVVVWAPSHPIRNKFGINFAFVGFQRKLHSSSSNWEIQTLDWFVDVLKQ